MHDEQQKQGVDTVQMVASFVFNFEHHRRYDHPMTSTQMHRTSLPTRVSAIRRPSD